jgi:hypothetical protein
MGYVCSSNHWVNNNDCEYEMSLQSNVNVLDTAAELIDRLEGSKMAERLIGAVERNDLEEVYYLNQSIIAGIAEDILLCEICKEEMTANCNNANCDTGQTL